ncbi:MAG: hypothetical protein H0W50_00165 [Parachlamydiaceae bacterium]|nr:hypothetical protein [Parachlamydiaceae bacterium]
MNISIGLIFETPYDKFKFQRKHFGNLCDPKITTFYDEADLKLVEKIREYLLNNSINFDNKFIYFPSFSNSYVQATNEISKITMKKTSLLLCNSLFSKSDIYGIKMPKDIIDIILIILNSLTRFLSCENFKLNIWKTMIFTNDFSGQIRNAMEKNTIKKIL